ncbi:hypothetical protein vBCbaSRXM_68 [Citromicrobium phage vB_CbaS-RXM]|nr:hypothetical protein vBCbaSRXM_68 [Citromicrobium phage vB_CbaS-RXM]
MLTTAITLLLASAAPSGIVHLECSSVGVRGDKVTWELALDEADGVATITTMTERGSNTRRVPASFTSRDVRFEDVTVSRIDLTLSTPAVVRLGKRVGGHEGQCRIAPTVARAF